MGTRRSVGMAGLAAVAAGVAACGSDAAGANASTGIDISGMYRVSHHTTSVNDCVNEGTELTTLTYFRVVPATDGGYWAVRCTGVDVSTCATPSIAAATSGDLIALVDEPAANGWTGTSAYGRTSSGCELAYSKESAHLVNGELRIEVRRYVDHPTLDAAACTEAEARTRAASMPCDEFDVFIGAKQ